MSQKIFNIGILGTGWIADKMATTLAGMTTARAYAVASRTTEKAEKFAAQFSIPKAYGNYEALADDPEVDLIYIATPHSHHFENTKMCLLKNKPVLCEKAFTVNTPQAEELIRIANERKVFLAEAIWTRYQPMRQMINNVINSGVIGKLQMLSANLCYPNIALQRMYDPALAGGALLDLGVYVLNFADMFFGDDIKSISSHCIKYPTGVDIQESITIEYNDGRIAVLWSSQLAKSDRQGIISGTDGFVIVENVNNPQSYAIYNQDYQLVKKVDCPPQITGYEYQVDCCIRAINQGKIEPDEMPHADTLRIMRQMDALRKEWGVKLCDEK
ncbi:MAG: Gfo/Idh/MocA family oxidoreductase [Bacteroidales bacterium]|nr:Gfo/Idh/MocA family oxidoreductase [Bacteroidales bacterium]